MKRLILLLLVIGCSGIDPDSLYKERISGFQGLSEYKVSYDLSIYMQDGNESGNVKMIIEKKDDLVRISANMDFFGQEVVGIIYKVGDKIFSCTRDISGAACEPVDNSNNEVRLFLGPTEILADSDMVVKKSLGKRTIIGRACDDFQVTHDNLLTFFSIPLTEDISGAGAIVETCLDRETGIALLAVVSTEIDGKKTEVFRWEAKSLDKKVDDLVIPKSFYGG